MTREDAVSYALMVVNGQAGPPTIAEAAKQLGVVPADLDSEFGVVTISPDRHLYSVRVDASKLPSGGSGKSGPFSDPPISPFGPE
jgi:hypothetical protein